MSQPNHSGGQTSSNNLCSWANEPSPLRRGVGTAILISADETDMIIDLMNDLSTIPCSLPKKTNPAEKNERLYSVELCRDLTDKYPPVKDGPKPMASRRAANGRT